MGFSFSSFSSPDSPLNESLLDPDNDIIFLSTDIVLAEASEFEIALDCEIWAHVGIVVSNSYGVQVFSEGEFVDIIDWLNRYENVIVRHCHCTRPLGFDATVMAAINDTIELMLTIPVESHFQEGWCVGQVLKRLGLVSDECVASGKLRPHHFSSGTPFTRLQLNNYSENDTI